VPDADLAARVRHELSHSPRTWHLPQPSISVLQGRVVLAGQAPHATGRADLERVVAAVPGVVAVDNEIIVA
jgi:osmotically-inducible protein OsmY